MHKISQINSPKIDNTLQLVQQRIFGKDITNQQTKPNDQEDQKINIIKAKIIQNMALNIHPPSACPFKVVEYHKQIYQYQRQKEKLLNSINYLETVQSNGINSQTRASLISWLLKINNKAPLKESTIHLCGSIIDRYLGAIEVAKSQFQLIGLAALWIASKYEDIYPPMMHELIYLSLDMFNEEEILDMESRILQTIEFDLSIPTTYNFFDILSIQLDFPQKYTQDATILMQIGLLDYKFCQYPSSLKAAGVYLLILNLNEIDDGDKLQKLTEYGSPELKEIQKKYFNSLINYFQIAKQNSDLKSKLCQKIQEKINSTLQK